MKIVVKRLAKNHLTKIKLGQSRRGPPLKSFQLSWKFKKMRERRISNILIC